MPTTRKLDDMNLFQIMCVFQNELCIQAALSKERDRELEKERERERAHTYNTYHIYLQAKMTFYGCFSN